MTALVRINIYICCTIACPCLCYPHLALHSLAFYGGISLVRPISTEPLKGHGKKKNDG